MYLNIHLKSQSLIFGFFKINFSGRAGSEVDLKAVVKTFTNLGFDVNVHKNLNYHDITNVLEDVSTVINHSRSDCFVLIFQSHGQHGTLFLLIFLHFKNLLQLFVYISTTTIFYITIGTVYAYDAPFPTQKLWEPFTADRAPTLIGKPKLFFIQVRMIHIVQCIWIGLVQKIQDSRGVRFRSDVRSSVIGLEEGFVELLLLSGLKVRFHHNSTNYHNNLAVVQYSRLGHVEFQRVRQVKC